MNERQTSTAPGAGARQKPANAQSAPRKASLPLSIAARILAMITITALLWNLPQREKIAPMIKSDNAYIFQAADRFHDGLGLTSVPPQAPLQAWEYQNDWQWLSQWPAGYPLLLASLRRLTGWKTAKVAQFLAAVCCAAALVGWFAFVRMACKGMGWSGVLLSVVAAGASVSVHVLVNPATDTLLVAIVPWLLAWAGILLRHAESQHDTARRHEMDRRLPTTLLFMCLGLAAGSCFWIRYAGVFLPAAVGLTLAVRWFMRTGVALRHVCAYGLGVIIPPLALVTLNQMMSQTGTLQQQMNLGDQVGFALSPRMFATAWMLWTDFSFYNHKWYSPWIISLIAPLAVFGLMLCRREWRQRLRAYGHRPEVMLSGAAVLSLFGLLISCTTLFGCKFDYVGLERYYRPVQPLYFVLLIAPVLLIDQRWWRACCALPMLIALHWLVQVDYPRPYHRWVAANRPTTAYGRWELAFAPQADGVYDWIREHRDDQIIIFSNFQDDIALETGFPALPLPTSRGQARDWISKVIAKRKLEAPRIYFFVDSDYHNRAYFLPPLDLLQSEFRLQQATQVPPAIQPFVYTAEALQPARLTER